MTATVLYLYGIAMPSRHPAVRRGRGARASSRGDGVGRERRRRLLASGIEKRVGVEALDVGTVACVVSRVSASTYEEGPLAERFKDAAWVLDRVRRHNEVLVDLARDLTLVPCRFCTLFRTQEALEHAVSARLASIQKTLDRLHGRVEWAVKAYAEPRVDARPGQAAAPSGGRRPRSRPAAAASAARSPGDPETGVDYLAGLIRQKERTRRSAERAREGAQEIADSIGAVVEEVVTLPARPMPDAPASDPVLNLACLVDRCSEPEFIGVLEGLAARHAELGATLCWSGPYPPYSFVDPALF